MVKTKGKSLSETKIKHLPTKSQHPNSTPTSIKDIKNEKRVEVLWNQHEKHMALLEALLAKIQENHTK